MKYTNDLDGYIQNMKDLLANHNEMKKKHPSRPGSDGIKMMFEFNIKTAQQFKKNGGRAGVFKI